MEEAKALAHQQQQLILQQQQRQQLLLYQQMQQKQRQQQQAISRFPSNIDAHLRPPGGLQQRPLIISNQQQIPSLGQIPNHQQHNQNPNPNSQQQQLQKPNRSPPNSIELQMAYQDAWRVCHPDFKSPFSSLEDACDRLLPYHVVADYEAEEDDRILESDTSGQIMSRCQQWDHNIAAKVSEFTATFEKQVMAFNIISRKRALGEFRSEERLMIEQALLQEERRAVMELRVEMESREKKAKQDIIIMASAASASAPIRVNAFSSQYDHQGGVSPDEMGNNNGWEANAAQRDEREPSDDFLNDEETDNGEINGQNEFDLNARCLMAVLW
ncbi:uncharacterized protein LOC124931907 [Impatiens glandulifera]|uniref:uncharacterized protein LOC124931907 n=1 Tax=Impatiens glandulifera TaxID=253017 RepID=UPI001FB06862|nr:uncharacterized protein LOC124931907 [Impatiens glandulifera]